MARLTAAERAALPDSAFAYIDSKGRRRLPIHDEAHVRNALARFERVAFESESARERARERLLRAAKKYGIVPVGFITGQFRAARRHAAAGRLVIELGRVGAAAGLEEQLQRALRDPSLAVLLWSEAAGTYLDGSGHPAGLPEEEDGRAVTLLERSGRPMAALVHDPAVLDDPDLTDTVLAAVRFAIEKEANLGHRGTQADTLSLPTGFLTLLFTDIEGSTRLLHRLEDGYASLLETVRSLIRRSVAEAGGREVDMRADECFAVFERVPDALFAAVALQRRMAEHPWPESLEVRVRAGIHSGPVTLTESGYIGLAVHAAARVSSAAHGGQVLVSEATVSALDQPPPGISFESLGEHRLAGLPRPVHLHQVLAEGLPEAFPPPRTSG